MKPDPRLTQRWQPRSTQALLCAIGLLAIGAVGCSKHDRLFDAVGASGVGGATVGTGGAPGLSGAGGYGLVDGLEPVGAAGAAGSASPADAGAGPVDPYTLPPSVSYGDGGVVSCGSVPCACNNGVDDDGDGKLDGFDEECTGALDDDEGTFATGIPGDNSDPSWQDCFYDGNSGAGDDHCRYHVDCLTGDKPASDPDCSVSADCLAFCQARTPNGCDCFGCCTIQLDEASSVNVFISESCSLEDVDDPARCQPCTPSAACGNTCGECELCPGKTSEDLPESCFGTPTGSGGGGGSEPAHTCDAGQTVCGGASDCGAGQYCSLGCCLTLVSIR